MNRIPLIRQSDLTMVFLILVWLMVACQTSQSTPPMHEPFESTEAKATLSGEVNATEAMATSPIAETLAPIAIEPTETIVPTVVPTPTPPFALEPTETIVPTVLLPTPVPWSGKLAFSSQRLDTNGDGIIDGNDGVHIYKLEVESEQLLQLTNGNHRDVWPSWSPDGKQIAFVSNRTGNFEIYTISSDGSNLRQITNSPEDEFQPSWSPDGEQIAYLLIKDLDSGEQERSLHLINPDGNITQELSIGPGNVYNPGWSPDGRYLTFEQEKIIVQEGITLRDYDYFFWDTMTGSITKLILEEDQFKDVYLLDLKWLPREGYYLSFIVEKRLSDTPSSVVKVYEVLWDDEHPTLSETFLIRDVYTPYVWGPNGEWLISLDSYDLDSEINLERSQIDLSRHPPYSALDDQQTNRLLVIDNIYFFSEPDWVP